MFFVANTHSSTKSVGLSVCPQFDNIFILSLEDFHPCLGTISLLSSVLWLRLSLLAMVTVRYVSAKTHNLFSICLLCGYL